MGKLFGTDGVRGIANSELTCELAFQIGQAGAYVLTKRVHGTPKIVIGKDTRVSGDMLEASLIAGICSVGANAVKLGVIPTPAVAYLTRLYKADAGVVISASHNSMEYNGIKFFNGEGYKLSDEIEEEIENLILNNNTELIDKPVGKGIGKLTREEEGIVDYVRFVRKTIDCDLKGLKIAVDCANGATYDVACRALAKLGASLVVINNFPNGTNINDHCGSTYMESLQRIVRGTDCDLGIAFDGDGDRMLAVDENGNIVDGDQIMAICAADLKAQGRLKNNAVVATVMSNLGLTIAGRDLGFSVKQTAVGDRYVLEQMLKTGEVIGGEQSGHVIFLDHNTTGDGLVSALQLLSIVKKSGKTLSQLCKVMKVLPQVTVSAKINNAKKQELNGNKEIWQMAEELSKALEGKGRVLIRASGTEPVVRVMMEGDDEEWLKEKAASLAALVERELA